MLAPRSAPAPPATIGRLGLMPVAAHADRSPTAPRVRRYRLARLGPEFDRNDPLASLRQSHD